MTYPAFLSISAGDHKIAHYNFKGVWKPYLWPLCGPHGNILRGASGEHQHQAGLFLAYGGHGPASGPTNIWSDWDEPPFGPCGKMLHLDFERIESDGDSARIVEHILYVNGSGITILAETREISIYALPEGECFIDWSRTVPIPNEPNGGPFMLSGRVCDSIRARDNRKKGADGRWELVENGGEMSSANGEVSREERFHGKEWVDFSGGRQEKQQGIALFDHPDNPGFPGDAHASAYGPIGLSHRHPGLDGGPENVRFRYGIYIHKGNASDGGVDAKYRIFCQS